MYMEYIYRSSKCQFDFYSWQLILIKPANSISSSCCCCYPYFIPHYYYYYYYYYYSLLESFSHQF